MKGIILSVKYKTILTKKNVMSYILSTFFLTMFMNVKAQLVGINTSNPLRPFHLKGDAYFDGTITVRNYENTSRYVDISHSGNQGNGHIDVYGEGGLYLNHFTGTKVSIGKGNGNVHTQFNTNGSIGLGGDNRGAPKQTILSQGDNNEVVWGNATNYIYNHTYTYGQASTVLINTGNPNIVLPGLDQYIEVEYPSKLIVSFGAKVTNNGSALKQSLIEFNIDATPNTDATLSIYTEGGAWDSEESSMKIFMLSPGGYTLTVAGQNTTNGNATFSVSNGFLNVMVIPQ